MSSKKGGKIVKPQKQRVKISMDHINSTFDRLGESYHNLITYEIYYTIVSVLIIFASLNNFYLLEINNLKIIIYALVALVLDLIKKLKKINLNFDPLGIQSETWLITVFDYILQINGFYLLARILYQIPASYSIFVVIHFLCAFYKNLSHKKKGSQSEDSQKFSYFKLQVLLLFICCKIIHSELSQVSFIFLIFAAINLILLIEVSNIIFMRQLLFQALFRKDYSVSDLKNKKMHINIKKNLLKNILLILSLVVVIQNILMVIQILRYKISINLLQSLIIGYYILKEYYKLEKSEII